MRSLLAFLLGICLSSAALAQQVPNPVSGPNSAVPGSTAVFDGPTGRVLKDGGGGLYARAFGVVADGVTSDDLAMKAAADACAAGSGHKLLLPAGSILLTGTTSITLNHCHIEGAGVGPAGGAVRGTTFLMTSTSVAPFILGDGGIGVTGVNFFWPSQTTGTAVYPPLFSITAACTAELYIDKVNILNAYDGFAMAAGGVGRWYIANSNMYAAHDMFQLGSVGDYIFITNVAFNQGSWQQVSGSQPWWATTFTNIAKVNTIFRILPGTTGAASTMNVSNTSAFGWGNGVLMAGGQLAFANFNWALDGVATVVDSTGAGTLHSIIMTCNSCTAGLADSTGAGATGNRTAFKLGASGSVIIQNSFWNPVPGNFVETAGATLFLTNNSVAFGSANDGNDYYLVKASSGNLHVDARNNFFGSAFPGTTKHHGFYFPSVMNGFSIQNNRSIYINDLLNAALGGGAYLFSGNVSEATTSSNTITTTGPGRFVYTGNYLDKPPLPVVSNCGAGASLGAGSVVSHGFIQVGSTVPTTTCQLTSPFTIGGTASCMFQGTVAGAGLVVASPTGIGPITWNITFQNDAASSQLFYHCGVDR